METRLAINDTSQELFLAALKTLALPPQRAEIEFIYKDIGRYSGVYEGVSNNSKYLALCKRNNTIPMCVKFQYNHDSNYFAFKEMFFLDNRPQTEKNARMANDCLMQGGKINKISFEARTPAQKGLETLLKTHVNRLLKQEYKFNMIDVVFSYADEDDSVADTNLFYMRDSLDLRIGRNIESKDAAKLSKWFKKLKNKYDK